MLRSFREIDAAVHLGFTQRDFDEPLTIHQNLMNAWRERITSKAKSANYLLCLVPLKPNVTPNSLTNTPYAIRAREFTEELREIMDGRLIIFNSAPTQAEAEAVIAREEVRAAKNANFRYWGEVLEECAVTFGGRIARGFGIPSERVFPIRELSINKRTEEAICELRAAQTLRAAYSYLSA